MEHLRSLVRRKRIERVKQLLGVTKSVGKILHHFGSHSHILPLVPRNRDRKSALNTLPRRKRLQKTIAGNIAQLTITVME